MPIRFSTEAANADHLKPEDETGAAPAGTPRQSPQDRRRGEAKAGDDKATAGKPGKDINAAGFIKDSDAEQT
jgi:hypothetical protein